MLVEWIRRVVTGPSQPSAPKATARPTARLQLETLEGRWVPAAIRNLAGFAANSLVRQDDSPSQMANVGFNLNFFGVMGNNVFVNNNGNITFGSAFSTFTPTALNTNNGGTPIIAPFFADVDTTNTASGVTTFGTDILCGRNAFGVNWINVGYFSGNVNKLNSFQLILVDRSETGTGNFDIEFNYDKIQWETGDASGGTNGLGGSSARLGYTNGSGTVGTFFEQPGSGINGAFLDTGPQALINTTRQASTPGRLHFLVRNGQVIDSTTMNLDVTSGTRSLFPLRFITDEATNVQRGNLVLQNIAPATPDDADSCLDITASLTPTNTSSTFLGPITVVFNNLPSGVQLVNATGTTGSGKSYITLQVDALPRDTPVLRVPIQLQNPSLEVAATYFVGFDVQVFAGTFDATAA